MSPLFLETIRLQDGQFLHLDYHQERLDRTLFDHYRTLEHEIDLTSALQAPADNQQGCFKVRVSYHTAIAAVEIVPYAIRPVEALQMVQVETNFDYAYKYADRNALQDLFSGRTFGDDVLLIRNGLLTDTSYANVALFDGQSWYTPARPLLVGTARNRLIAERQLQIADIYQQDLPTFQTLRLVNAMMDWDEAPNIPIGQIRK